MCNKNLKQDFIVLPRSTGFIIEGFPQTSDELRFLCSKGFYPDVVVMLQVGTSGLSPQCHVNCRDEYKAVSSSIFSSPIMISYNTIM